MRLGASLLAATSAAIAVRRATLQGTLNGIKDELLGSRADRIVMAVLALPVLIAAALAFPVWNLLWAALMILAPTLGLYLSPFIEGESSTLGRFIYAMAMVGTIAGLVRLATPRR